MSSMIPEDQDALQQSFRRRLDLIEQSGRKATQNMQMYSAGPKQMTGIPRENNAFGAGGGFEAPGGSDVRSRILSQASRWIGTDYSWGGGGSRGPSRGIGRGRNTFGFDCSGLVQNAYASVGISLPRTARQQATRGKRTSIRNLKPGDLVAWNNGKHIAVYAGNGMIIEAPRTGLQVRRRALGRNEAVFGVSLGF